jgi:hypothetical protein
VEHIFFAGCVGKQPPVAHGGHCLLARYYHRVLGEGMDNIQTVDLICKQNAEMNKYTVF